MRAWFSNHNKEVCEALCIVVKLLFIKIVMETSLSGDSKPSSFARLIDKEMLQDFHIMKDMVKKLYEDVRESTKLQEQLVAIKKEKQELLQKMHEMEIQLHDAK